MPDGQTITNNGSGVSGALSTSVSDASHAVGDDKKVKTSKKTTVVIVVLAALLVVLGGMTTWLLLDKFVFNDNRENVAEVEQGGNNVALDEDRGDSDGTTAPVANTQSLPNVQLTRENFLPLTEGQQPGRWYSVGLGSLISPQTLSVELITKTSEKAEAICGSDAIDSIEPSLRAMGRWDSLNGGNSVGILDDIPVVGIDANNVVDVLVGGIGQDLEGLIVFFLMKDGTVEYTTIDYIRTNKEIRSQGKIPGVENVIGLREVGAGDCYGARTVVANTIDGKFYDFSSWFHWKYD